MKFKKLISLLILITFILNIAAQSSYSSIAVSLPAEYNLNKSFASNLYGSGNGNIVFLVQDLHCHYGTQNEIALFLKNISENENFNKIYVEGLSKDINGNFIKNLPEDIKNPLIENLFKEGRISGAEYFFLNSTKDMPLYALEDEKLYSDNGQRLEYILNTQKEAGKIISAMEKEIKSLRREKLTNANKKIFSALLKYENGKISQNNYYKYLYKCLQNVEKTARGGVSNLKTSDYAHIKEFINLPDKINYKQAQKELQAYLNAAKNILPYSAYSELVKNNEIYENLSKINKDYNIDMKKYAELEKSVRAYEYAKNADMLKLYNEEESLVNEILIKNASNSEIETIILSLAFEKFKRFMTNNATDSDYKYLAEFGLDYFGELWNKNIESETFEKISGYIEIYNAYYDANNRRNIEFANRIISGIDVRKTQSMTVAITGGFHTEELKELLLEKNIDVAVLTPKISGGIKEAEKKYKKLFGEQVQAETIGAAINAYALRSYLNSPGKQTELISALSDVNRLYKDKAFGNLTLEEVFRQIIDKYNNIEDIKENPSNTVSVIEVKNNKKGFSAVLTFKDKTHTITINQNGDVAVSGQTISGKDTKLKPGSLLNDRFKNKDSRLYKAYTILIAPLWEEWVFRGFPIIIAVAVSINPLILLIPSGILFVALHKIFNKTLTPKDLAKLGIVTAVYTAGAFILPAIPVTGFLFEALQSVTGFIIPSVVAHTVYNALVVYGILKDYPVSSIGNEEEADSIEKRRRLLLSFGDREDREYISIFAEYSKITPQELEKLIEKYGKKPWFKELFSGKYSIWQLTTDNIEIIRMLASLGDDYVNRNTIDFAIDSKMTSGQFEKYSKELWLERLFSEKYSLSHLKTDGIEKIRMLASLGDDFVNRNTVGFATYSKMTSGQFEKLIEKYGKEPWFRELLSGKYDTSDLTTKNIEETREKIRMLASLGDDFVNKKTIDFAINSKMTSGQFEKLIEKYDKEPWFKELFSGEYNISGLTTKSVEEIRVMASLGDDYVNKVTIDFACNFSKQLEEFIEKYSKEPWFKRLFSGEYRIWSDLTTEFIEKIIMLASLGDDCINQKTIDFARDQYSTTPLKQLKGQIKQYGKELWFKKLFSGKYDITFLEIKHIEIIRILSSLGDNYVNEKTINFATRPHSVLVSYPEEFKKLIEKYGKEPWFKELLSGKYDIRDFTPESIEKIRILSSLLGDDYINQKNIDFVVRSEMYSSQFEKLIEKYGKEPWFKELLSGEYDIRNLTPESIEKIRILVSLGDDYINQKNIDFAVRSEMTSDQIEKLIEKYGKKSWFKELFSGKYRIWNLTPKSIKKIEILLSLGVNVAQNVINFAINSAVVSWELAGHREYIHKMKSVFSIEEITIELIKFAIEMKDINDKILKDKKEIYLKMLSMENLFDDTPEEVIQNLREGKLSFKELVIWSEDANKHNINGTYPESIKKLRKDLDKVSDVIAKYDKAYKVGKFFEIRTNYTLDELLQNDDRLRLYIDEIIYAVYDIERLLKDKKQDTSALSSILNRKPNGRDYDYHFVRGNGIEYSLTMRNVDNYAIGDRTGDCTGTNHGAVNRANFRGKWLMHPDYEVLQVFIDGKFTNRFDFIAGKVNDKPAILIHAQENIPQFRDGTSSLIDQRDIAYYKALNYLIEFAKRNGFEEVYVNSISNSSDISKKSNAVSKKFNGEVYYPYINLQDNRSWRLVSQEKVKEQILQEESLLGEKQFKTLKLKQIKSLIENELFERVYIKGNEYIIPVSDNVAVRFAMEDVKQGIVNHNFNNEANGNPDEIQQQDNNQQQRKKERMMSNFINIANIKLDSYERKEFESISAQEKSSLLNAGISAKFNIDIFNSLDMLSLSIESLFTENNADRLTSKLRLLINWGKLYKLDDDYAAVIGKTKDGQTAVVRYRQEDKSKAELKLTSKIEVVKDEGAIAKSDEIKEEATVKRVKGVLLSKRGLPAVDASLIKDAIKEDFKTYFDNSDKQTIIVYIDSKILKFQVDISLWNESRYAGSLEFISPQALPVSPAFVEDGIRSGLYNANINPITDRQQKDVKVSIDELANSRLKPVSVFPKGNLSSDEHEKVKELLKVDFSSLSLKDLHLIMRCAVETNDLNLASKVEAASKNQCTGNAEDHKILIAITELYIVIDPVSEDFTVNIPTENISFQQISSMLAAA